mgnify:CR=1 FL=1
MKGRVEFIDSKTALVEIINWIVGEHSAIGCSHFPILRRFA